MNLEELKQEIPFKWRVQSYSKFKPQASCVAYIDARDAMDLLDKVCGAENWQVTYKDVGGLLFAEVGIKINEWVWKSDTGSESNVEKDKGHASDAFKRACVHWGIGRFLYSKKIKYIDANEKKVQGNYPYPIFNGQRVWDLTKHFNDIDSLNNYKPALTLETFDKIAVVISEGVDRAKIQKRLDNYNISKDQQTEINRLFEEFK